MTSPGSIRFRLDRQISELIAFEVEGDDKALFLIFRDETSGDETYGAGRFLRAGVLEGGKVEIDFNRAYNPPCAFTPYATCPLPPPQNWLSVRIEAGEMSYEGGQHGDDE